MKRVIFSVLFFIRKTRLGKNGKTPVLLRITVNGLRKECSINLYVKPEDWNSIAEKSLASTHEAYELNLRIESIRLKIMKIHREAEFDTNEITAEYVMNKYLGKDKYSKTVLEIFGEHNKKCKAIIGKGMTPLTVERYKTTMKHVEDFISTKYNKEDYPLNKVNHEFITELDFYR